MSNDDGFEDCMTSARSAVEAISSFNERAQPGPRWVDVQVHAALSDLRSALVILAARADPSRVARAVAGGMGGKPGLPSVEPETTSTFGCDVGRTELGEAIERAGFEARFDIAGHVRLACAVERERARIVEAIRERERVERADPWAKDYEAGIAMGLAMAAAFVETGKW